MAKLEDGTKIGRITFAQALSVGLKNMLAYFRWPGGSTDITKDRSIAIFDILRLSAMGGGSALYTFSSGTSGANPGAGGLSLNNSTQNAATGLTVNATDAAGSAYTSVIQKAGVYAVVGLNNPSKWLVFLASADPTVSSGFCTVTGTVLAASSAAPFAATDPLSVSFHAVGRAVAIAAALAGATFTQSQVTGLATALAVLSPLNKSYLQLKGTPPPPDSKEIKTYQADLVELRLLNVPQSRTHKFWFATTGNDSNLGTEASPYLSPAKMQALHDAGNGDQEFIWASGTYRDDTSISITKDNITIRGDPLDPPLFTAFIYQHTTGWTHDSGDLYHRAEANDVSWVMEANDTKFPFVHGPYKRMDSSANVATTPKSWYYDGSTLYINAGAGVNPNTLTGGHEYGRKVHGVWAISNDNTRLEKIRLHGQGINYPGGGQSYQVQFGSGKLHAEYVVVDCEIILGGYHNIGCTGSGANILTVVRTLTGLGTYDSGGSAAVVVNYSDFGGQECVLQDCKIAGGPLPNYATSGQPYIPYFAHTNGTPGYAPAYLAAIDTQYPNVPNQVAVTGTWGTAVAERPEDVRTYIIGERPEANVTPSWGSTVKNVVYIDCHYDLVWTGPAGSLASVAVFSSGAGSGIACAPYAYNTTVRIDVTGSNNSGQPLAWFYGNGNAVAPVLENGRMEMYGANSDGIVLSQSGDTIHATALIRNTLVLFNLSTATVPTRNNAGWTSAKLVNNAYQCPNGVSDFTGATTAPVTLTAVPADDQAPANGGPLYGTGTDNQLEYDARGGERPSDRFDIGPLIAAAAVGVTDAFFLPGSKAAALTGGVVTSLIDLTAGLALDLDADQPLYQDSARTTLALAASDPVGSFSDNSGGGFHATASTTARPLLVIVGGKRWVRYDGSNDVSAIVGDPVSANPSTIFCSIVVRGTPGIFYPAYISGGATGQRVALQGGGGSGSDTHWGSYNGGGQVSGTILALNTRYVIAMRVGAGGTPSAFFTNGVYDGRFSFVGDVVGSGSGNAAVAAETGAGRFSQIDVRRIMLYNTLLSDDAVAAISKALLDY